MATRAERRRIENEGRKRMKNDLKRGARADLNPRSTAYHEAAHAVVGEIVGLRTQSATINPSDGLIGSILREEQNIPHALVPIFVASILAGSVAEERLGTMPRGFVPVSDWDELASFWRKCGFSEEDWARAQDAGCLLVRIMLAHPGVWSAINETAESLIANRTLSGDGVREIVTSRGLPQMHYRLEGVLAAAVRGNVADIKLLRSSYYAELMARLSRLKLEAS